MLTSHSFAIRVGATLPLQKTEVYQCFGRFFSWPSCSQPLPAPRPRLTLPKRQNRRPQSRLSVNRQAGFRRVLDQKNQVTTLEAQLKSRQQEVDAITKDQARLRENMKALKGSSEEMALLQRYTRQLDSQEDRLNTLGKEISDLQEKRTREQEKLDRMVQEITLDQNL